MSEARVQGNTIKGELAATNPAKLIFNLVKQKKSGILTFDDGVTKARLFFKDGCVVPWFDGIKKDKNFRRYLINGKKATRDEMRLAKKLSLEQKRNSIDILIEKNILDKFTVVSEAEDFFWKSVGSAFGWRHGSFTFQDHELGSFEGKCDLGKTLNLIVGGVKNHFNQGLIKNKLKTRMKTKILRNKKPAFDLSKLHLTDKESGFAEKLLGSENLFDALDETPLPYSESQALAFTLLTMGFMKFKPSAKKKADKSKPMTALDKAIAEAAQSVDRIRERVKSDRGQEDAEFPEMAAEAPDFGAAPDEASAEELQQKLRELYDAKGESGEFSEEYAEEGYDEQGEYYDDGFGGEDEFGGEDAFDGGDSFGDGDLVSGEDALTGGGDEFGEGSMDEYDDSFEEGGPALFDAGADELVLRAEDSPKEIFELGKTYADQGAYSVAIQAFQEVINRGEDAPEVRAHLGWSMYNEARTGDGFNQSTRYLMEALKTYPNSHWPYLFLGKIYDAESDKNMAELYYVKALELNRECDEAKNNIKRLYDDR